MNKTLVQHQSGQGLIPGSKLEANYYEIEKIELIQSPSVWRNYIYTKQYIQKKYSNAILNLDSSKHLKKYPPLTPLLDKNANEYYFFHGTSKEVTSKITTGGFDERFSNDQGMFGGGIYFADNSSKSNQYVPCPTCGQGWVFAKSECKCAAKDVKEPFKMIISRVVIGDAFICKEYKDDLFKSKREAPLKDQKTHYDSVVGETVANGGTVLKFREYIVYERTQSYPEFVVTYQRKMKKWEWQFEWRRRKRRVVGDKRAIEVGRTLPGKPNCF